MSLNDAAYALDELAAGRKPERPRLLSGALALDTLCHQGDADRALLDAAAGLRIIAAGGDLDLSGEGKARGGACGRRPTFSARFGLRALMAVSRVLSNSDRCIAWSAPRGLEHRVFELSTGSDAKKFCRDPVDFQIRDGSMRSAARSFAARSFQCLVPPSLIRTTASKMIVSVGARSTRKHVGQERRPWLLRMSPRARTGTRRCDGC
jgi:hypothetical protein